MRLNLMPYLELIARMLFLEPVLRYLLAKGLINKESWDNIKNPYTNQSDAARNEALVVHINEDATKVTGFMDALHQTGQTDLAELIETGEDADSGKNTVGKQSQSSSQRSRELREKEWVCAGLPQSDKCCAPDGPTKGKWDSKFQWCRHPDCRRYLCAVCRESHKHATGGHKHKSNQLVDVKTLHAAAYQRAKKDEERKRKNLCKVADEIGQKVSQTLQSHFLAEFDKQSPLRSFEEYLFVHLVHQPDHDIMLAAPTEEEMKIKSDEASVALESATQKMGGSVPPPKDVVPEGLKNLPTQPEALLHRLLAPPADAQALPDSHGEVLTLQDLLFSDPVTLLASLLVPGADSLQDEPARPGNKTETVADNETLAMITEEREELSDLAFLKDMRGGDEGIPLEDMYGQDAKPEHAPPALLKLLLFSKLDEQGNYSSSVMDEVAKAGDELLTVRDARGWTTLHIAAARGATGLTRLLLQRPDVDVDVRDNDGSTPLMVAVVNDRLTTATMFIIAGADVTAKNIQGRNVLHITCAEGKPQMLQSLLKTFPRDAIDAVDDTGRTALFEAALGGSAECVGQLLGAGADQSIAEESGAIPLHAAAQKGHLDVVRLLLADAPRLVNAQDKQGSTPIMLACEQGWVEVANILMDAGADLEIMAKPAGYAAIHWAAKNGSVALVKELIDRGSPINFPSKGESCLQVACLNGRLEAAEVLVEKGADLYHVDAEGFCAFSSASQEGEIDVLEFLLSRPFKAKDVTSRERCAGEALRLAALNDHLTIVQTLVESEAARPDYSHPDSKPSGTQAIHAAAEAGLSTIVKYLLNKGFNPDATNEQGVTPLMFAAGKGQVECVRTLLEGGASAALFTPQGTALHVAVGNGQAETTALLLNHTPKHYLEAKNSAGSTVLHYAAMRGHIDIFRQLCEHGANLGSLLEDGTSCLHIAAQEGHGEIVDFVLQSEEGRALLDAKGKGGGTALMRAAHSGRVVAAAVLLAWGADPLLRSADGRTALHLAVINEAPEMLQLLLQCSMDINQQNDHGNSTIMLAAAKGHSESVALLAEAGAELNLVNNSGFGVLHAAAMAAKGGLATVEALIAAGADVHKVDINGCTCLHFAAGKGNADVVGSLLADGRLSPNVQDKTYRAPLHWASREGNSQTVKVLLGLGADPNPMDGHDSTPLNMAAQYGHLDTVAALLSFGADPGIRDKDGDSPMDCARAKGHADVVRLLEEHKEQAAALASGGDPKVHGWLKDLNK